MIVIAAADETLKAALLKYHGHQEKLTNNATISSAYKLSTEFR
jgi:hypothetical protein